MEYIPAKSIVTRVKGGGNWFGIDYNMNIYKGCCHGCIYCDSRSSCYRTERFDQVRAKEDALRIIRDELRRKVRTGVVGTGAMSDPYNPYEAELKLTRHALELIDAFGFGAAIDTKGTLITRDVDVLKGIMEHSPVLCKITITAADDGLSGKLEPGAPRSSQRFEALEALSSGGIFSGVLMTPVLPYIEDTSDNVQRIVRLAHEAGARFIYAWFGVTLRDNQREWFLDRLREAFPEERLEERYLRKYGNSYVCRSPAASQLRRLFVKECERYGILYEMKDIICAYKRNYQMSQIGMFDR